MRAALNKVSPARARKVSPGNKEKTRSQAGPASRLGNGRNHPPSRRVTKIDDTAIIAEYSARKNKDKRNPLYSVCKPDMNSHSASRKPNGARFVSATIATAKTNRPTSPTRPNLK